MAAVTVVYPKGCSFNMDYYKSTHMPLVDEHWKPMGLKSWQILNLGEDAPYKICAILQWGSIEEFQKAASSDSAKIVLGDVPNFCDAEPTILAGPVVISSS